jgi:hypothetical protein
MRYAAVGVPITLSTRFDNDAANHLMINITRDAPVQLPPIKSAHFSSSVRAAHLYARRVNGGLFEITLRPSDAAAEAWDFDASSCREAAQFFDKLAFDLETGS